MAASISYLDDNSQAKKVELPPCTFTLYIPPPPPPPLQSTHLVLFLLLFLLLLLCGVGVPGEALLVERDDHLGTFDVGLPGRDEVRLVGVLPVQ